MVRSDLGERGLQGQCLVQGNLCLGWVKVKLIPKDARDHLPAGASLCATHDTPSPLMSIPYVTCQRRPYITAFSGRRDIATRPGRVRKVKAPGPLPLSVGFRPTPSQQLP